MEPFPVLVEEIARTVGHFFPEFGSWLAGLPDMRCPDKVVYEKDFCIWEAMDIIQIVHAIVQLLVRGPLARVFRLSIRSVMNLFRCVADSFH